MSSSAAALPPVKPGNEPSMEEILASIRKIIADDSVGTKKDEAYVPPPAPPPVEAKAPEPAHVIEALPPEPDEPDADVLDLAEVAVVTSEMDDLVMIGEPEPVIEEDDDLIGTPVHVAVAPPPAKPLASVGAMESHILSNETGGLVANAFAALQRTTAMPAAGRTLEDVVSEMLRPLLRDWMDSHLPGIVERLVKAEIERVSRGN